MMDAVAGVIPFKAKPGQGAEVARLIAAALPHVEAESGTPLWLVLRSNADADTVFLVDLFSGPNGRDAHMKGEAAKLIFATVPPLLEAEPVIHPADVVARKGA
jgi:quinol monooxygenase YgiN